MTELEEAKRKFAAADAELSRVLAGEDHEAMRQQFLICCELRRGMLLARERELVSQAQAQ